MLVETVLAGGAPVDGTRPPGGAGQGEADLFATLLAALMGMAWPATGAPGGPAAPEAAGEGGSAAAGGVSAVRGTQTGGEVARLAGAPGPGAPGPGPGAAAPPGGIPVGPAAPAPPPARPGAAAGASVAPAEPPGRRPVGQNLPSAVLVATAREEAGGAGVPRPEAGGVGPGAAAAAGPLAAALPRSEGSAGDVPVVSSDAPAQTPAGAPEGRAAPPTPAAAAAAPAVPAVPAVPARGVPGGPVAPSDAQARPDGAALPAAAAERPTGADPSGAALPAGGRGAAVTAGKDAVHAAEAPEARVASDVRSGAAEASGAAGEGAGAGAAPAAARASGGARSAGPAVPGSGARGTGDDPLAPARPAGGGREAGTELPQRGDGRASRGSGGEAPPLAAGGGAHAVPAEPAARAEHALPVPVRPTAEELSRLLAERARVHEGREGVHSLHLTLEPEHLGRVRLELAWRDDGLSVSFAVQHPEALAMLEGNLHRLEALLRDQGLPVASLQAALAGDAEGGAARARHREAGGRQGVPARGRMSPPAAGAAAAAARMLDVLA